MSEHTKSIDISMAKQVFETTSYKEVNRYLASGWVLIETYKTCYDPQLFPNEQSVNYVLAWNKEGEPVKPDSEYELSNSNVSCSDKPNFDGDDIF